MPLMGEGYSKAALVKVWLGVGDEEAEHALRDIAQSYVDTRWRFFSPGEGKSRVQELCELIFSQTYWTRIWVVQEFVLAKELLLCYGSVQVAPHLFYQALIRLILSSLKHNPAEFEAIRSLHANQMFEHRSRGIAHNGYELAALLTKYKNFEATELNDLVYVLLGLATDIETVGINVDYDSSFMEFLLEVS